MPDSIFAFFGLRENPFKISPDPRFLFVTEEGHAAADELVYAVRNRKGLILLTGEVGTGKTMLVRRLLDWLAEEQMPTALIFNSRIRPEHLLDFILNDFGVPCDSQVKSDKLMALNRWLLDRYRAGQTPVLVVDEAQGLSADTLEEVRLLLNFETPRDKLLQIVLAGQPELDTMLKRHELRQLRQRISIRSRTAPLTPEQTADYIRHRLRVAGAGNDAIFEPEAAAAVYAHTHGIPRVINVLCEHAMVNACADGSATVSRAAVDQAASECHLDRAESVARILQTGSYSAAELAEEIRSILGAVSSRLGQSTQFRPQAQAVAAGAASSSTTPAPAHVTYFNAFERTFPNSQPDFSSADAATSILASFGSVQPADMPAEPSGARIAPRGVATSPAAVSAIAAQPAPEIETIPLPAKEVVVDALATPVAAEPQDVEVRVAPAHELASTAMLSQASDEFMRQSAGAKQNFARQSSRPAPRAPENFRELLAFWGATFSRDARASYLALQRQLHAWRMTYWNPAMRGLRREARQVETRIVRFLSDPQRIQNWKQRWNQLDASVQRSWRATPLHRWLQQPLGSQRKSSSDHRAV